MDPGQIVRQLLFDPLMEEIGDAHRLWLAPAEAVHLVPFEALPVEGGGGGGDRFEIVQLGALEEPKAKALWNAKQALREQLDREGNPIYSIRD